MSLRSHLARETIIDVIGEGAHDEAPSQSHEDVTWEVDTQIHTCPAVGERPDDKGEGEHTTADEPAEIDGDAECVGRVGREETVVAPTIAIDDIYQQTYLRIVRRSPSCHCGLDDQIVHRTSQQHTEACPSKHTEHLAEILVVADDDIEQAEIKRQPGECRREHVSHTVEIERVAAVDSKQPLLVECDKVSANTLSR